MDEELTMAEEMTLDSASTPSSQIRPSEKAYGYTFDNNHEAALEAKLIRQINALGQIRGNKVPHEVQGNIQALITEIRGFMRKWRVTDSYAEKCSPFVGDYKGVDIYLVNCLYNDFMAKADKLGFKNATNTQEDWEKRFLGLSS
jgi:hypothetical protein